ncbi:MAG: HAD hydrolase-like protein, partial [Bacteroidota bacterium]|nr:HAD hydrolase-like protein [Bacteroidota bacterium]
MKYTVLIFDQDGTIADTLPLIAQAVINSYKSLTNKLLTQNEVMATFGISEEGIMNRLFPAMPEEAFKTYLEQYEQLH